MSSIERRLERVAEAISGRNAECTCDGQGSRRVVRFVGPDDPAPCPSCGGKLRYLGEDVSEVLERVPQQFKVIRHVRPKFSCSCCSQIVQAPAARRPIERSIAGAGFLAHILTAKYCDHQPLYRQSQIYARDGIDLDRSTLAGRVRLHGRSLEIRTGRRSPSARCR
jgi:transposase